MPVCLKTARLYRMTHRPAALPPAYIFTIAANNLLRDALPTKLSDPGNSVEWDACRVGIEIGADIPNKEVAALIENCTIVDNPTGWGWRHVNTTATSAVHFVNTIIYGHDTDVVGLANRTYFTNCLSSVALPGDNNITNVAPTFVDGYHLAGDSAGVNAGLNQAWMTEPGAKDLDGQTRVDRFSGKVDMGCYEHIPRGTAFLLR